MADQYDVPLPQQDAAAPAQVADGGFQYVTQGDGAEYEDAVEKLLTYLEGKYADLPADIREAFAPLRPQSNIQSVSVGLKNDGLAADGQKCVVVGVRSKLPKGEVFARDVIPDVVPGTNVRTDVVEDPEKVTGAALGTHHPLPVPLGAGVSHFTFPAVGTLGALVIANVPSSLGGPRTAQRCILSNNHVIGLLGAANFGDSIFQASAGGGRQIGVFRDRAPFLPSGNKVDAALAGTNLASVRPQYVSGTTLYNGQGPKAVAADPFVGMQVTVIGAASGFPRTCTVTNTAIAAPVPLPAPGGGMQTVQFADLFQINGQPHVGMKGDSGSLVITKDPVHGWVPVGLYIGDNATQANPVGTFAYACKIRNVIGHPNLQIQSFC